MGSLWRVAIGLLCAAPVPALAQAPSSASAFDLERLELNPSGVGSLVVGSGELLPPSTFRSAVLAHYENDPLPLVNGGTLQGQIVRERLTLDLMRQYSLAQRVEFALILPIVVYQTGDVLAGQGLPPLASGGLASPFVSARVALLRSVDGAPIDLALQAGTALPFGNPAAFARNPGLTLAPRLLASRRLFDFVMISAEAGGVLRPPVELGNQSIHNEVSGNLALATLAGPLRGELAVRGAYYFDKVPASLEALAGVRHAVSDRVEISAIAAAGLMRAPGTPAFRVLFGASFLEGTRSADMTQRRPAPADPPKATVASIEKPPEVKPPDVKPPEVKPVVATASEKKPEPRPEPKPVCVAGQPHDPKACPDLDLDGDGIKNSEDKCPSEKGTAELHGCPVPDRDHDGVPDAEDQCPDDAGPKERRGCPLKDSDGDGILDEFDGCPHEKGPVEARGCPVKDTDGDGIPDYLDNCPAEKGTKENHGCPPAKKQLVFITREKLVISDKVYFDTDKSTIQPRSFTMLKQIAEVLSSHPEIRKVIVEGHTDNVGSPMHNLRLSQERAASVERYLVMNGVDALRLDAIGFGQSRPIMPNLLPRGREANRRVEFRIPESDEAAPGK